MTLDQHQQLLRARVGSALAARVAAHVPRLAWTADELRQHQRDRLRALLAKASTSSPFHAPRLRGVDVDRFELGDLGTLPTMTKAHLMAAFDDVLTDRRLSLTAVEEHLISCAEEPGLLLGEYVCLASGGSSGERGVFVQTVDEYADFVAALTRRRLASGAGRPKDAPVLIALVAAASPIHSSGFGAATSGGPVQLVSCPATLPLSELVDRLNALQPPTLMGYPTKLVELASEQVSGRLDIAPESITSISELLTGEDRATITAAFGVPVIDQFVCTEGLVGQSEPDGSVITFASDMCIVELVDDANRPVERGEVASKILVTNLHNLTQPLIRYELTDRLVEHEPNGGHLRASVDGRADAVFRYPNAVIHPLTIRTVLVKEPVVREYQVHQTSQGIHVDLVLSAPLDQARLAAKLTFSLRAAGMSDPSVTVTQVPAVPRHPDTGKQRRFIPLATEETPARNDSRSDPQR